MVGEQKGKRSGNPYNGAKDIEAYLELASGHYNNGIHALDKIGFENSNLIQEVMNYNPAIEEKGPTNTDKGHNLADALIRKYGSIEDIPEDLRKGNKSA
ncbi:MAG: hypothetical protein ABEJ02_01625 [Candidatus Paceibacteria bacterium]